MRVTDGQKATLKIGQRVPVATGSFQAGVGVGVGGGAGVVNPLVNTQFQYLDVGVNIDVTPRVHPDGDVSMKLTVDVSSIAGTSNIGGINQPIISQRKIEHDVRLKEGEVEHSGRIDRADGNEESKRHPGLGASAAGEVSVFGQQQRDSGPGSADRADAAHYPVAVDHRREFAHDGGWNRFECARVSRRFRGRRGAPTKPVHRPRTPAARRLHPGVAATNPAGRRDSRGSASISIRRAVTMKPGDKTTLGLSVSNVTDLYSIPLLIHYNPAVVQVEEVRNGGFLVGRHAGNCHRAANRRAARRSDCFRDAPAEYSGRERNRNAAWNRGAGSGARKHSAANSSGQCT